MALSIFCFCFSHGVALVAQWIPRSLNGRADLLSRFVSKDDWRVNPPCFDWLMPNGTPTRSTVLPPIITLSFRVSTPSLLLPVAPVLTVDALVQDWSGENNSVCPTVGIVVNAVRVLTGCSGRGTLIIPEWPRASFWPLLL